MLALLPLAILGCKDQADVDTEPVEDQFADHTAVRIVSPASGETLEEAFVLRYEAGADVALAQVRVDGEPVGSFVEVDESGRQVVTVASGRHVVEVVGYDSARGELSSDSVEIRVLADPAAAWVSIASPTDGSHPFNPVQFAIEASDDVERVELLADDWVLGSTDPGGVLTYTFGGTGYARIVEANAYDAEGALVASDSIEITVEAGEEAPPSDFNDIVVSLMTQYPTDGTIEYWWPSGVDWSGSTRDLYYQGGLVADDGGVSACFCVGLTWEVYFRAWQELDLATGGDGDDLHGLARDEVLDMRVDWFVRELDGPGASVAFETRGLGIEVDSFDDWKAGDFVQFWRRSGSGHNVIFLDWITDDAGNRLGMDYWSCNGPSSTDGPGTNDEYFGTHTSAMDPLLMYAGRAYMPEDWY